MRARAEERAKRRVAKLKGKKDANVSRKGGETLWVEDGGRLAIRKLAVNVYVGLRIPSFQTIWSAQLNHVRTAHDCLERVERLRNAGLSQNWGDTRQNLEKDRQWRYNSKLAFDYLTMKVA